MTVTRMRPSLHDRVSQLEDGTKAHAAMAAQVEELYEAWTRIKTINWFLVKSVGWAGGSLGFLAILLTIANTVRMLIAH